MITKSLSNSSLLLALTTTLLAASATAACDLKVESAWIREAPPNATTLAGYAVLRNVGTKSLGLMSIESPAFAAIELHESIMANGVASMRSVDKLVIAAGDKIEFSPNGKHFMLMGPKQILKRGDAVSIQLQDSNGCVSTASFKVSAVAADKPEMDHSKMGHSMPMGK